MPKAAGTQLLLRIRNSPSALTLRGARTSDNDSLCRAGLSIDERSDLSIDHIIGNGKGLACAYRTARPNDKQWSDLYATLQLSEGR